MTFAIGRADSVQDSCDCLPGYAWNDTELNCVINCTDIQNTDGRTDDVENTCLCVEGYLWNTTETYCVPDCLAMDYTVGRMDNALNCTCQLKFEWN